MNAHLSMHQFKFCNVKPMKAVKCIISLVGSILLSIPSAEGAPVSDRLLDRCQGMAVNDSVYEWHEERDVMVQVKTNALWALVGTLNLGAEIQVDPSCSIDIPVWYSPYDMGSHRRKWRLLAMQPEVRWWWQGRAGEGHFGGVHLTVAGFNVAFKGTERYQDSDSPAVGLGLSYGYSRHLDSRHRWWIDFNVGAGFVRYCYDTFDNERNGRLVGHGKGTYWGITRASVGIAYRWMWHHKRRKGGEP